MIGLPQNTKIFLRTEPVDFRKGFDGLTGVVTTTLGRNAVSYTHLTLPTIYSV